MEVQSAPLRKTPCKVVTRKRAAPQSSNTGVPPKKTCMDRLEQDMSQMQSNMQSFMKQMGSFMSVFKKPQPAPVVRPTTTPTAIRGTSCHCYSCGPCLHMLLGIFVNEETSVQHRP